MSAELFVPNVVSSEKPKRKMPPTPARVAKVIKLQEAAKAAGFTLERHASELDDKWIAWHRAIVNG